MLLFSGDFLGAETLSFICVFIKLYTNTYRLSMFLFSGGSWRLKPYRLSVLLLSYTQKPIVYKCFCFLWISWGLDPYRLSVFLSSYDQTPIVYQCFCFLQISWGLNPYRLSVFLFPGDFLGPQPLSFISVFV